MKTLEISTASQPLSTYVEEFSNEMVILTLHGKAIAVVTSLNNVDPESLPLSLNPEFREIIQKSREEFKAGKKLSLDDIKREFL